MQLSLGSLVSVEVWPNLTFLCQGGCIVVYKDDVCECM